MGENCDPSPESWNESCEEKDQTPRANFGKAASIVSTFTFGNRCIGQKFLVKANGTQKVIESFPSHYFKIPIFTTLLLSFCNISFPGKVRWSESHRQHNRTLSPQIHCRLWEGRGSCLLLGLPQVFSDLGRSQTYRHQQSQRAYCPHWAEVCQGLRDENLVFGSVRVCETPSGGCICHTRASNFGFFTT